MPDSPPPPRRYRTAKADRSEGHLRFSIDASFLLVAFLAAALVIGSVIWSRSTPEFLEAAHDPSGSAGHQLPQAQQWLGFANATVDGWPHVTVEQVVDVPGAEVLAAWAAPAGVAQFNSIGSTERSVDLSRSARDGERYLLEIAPQIADRPLPQRFAPGEDIVLVVLWGVADCETLPENESIRVHTSSLYGFRDAAIEHFGGVSVPSGSMLRGAGEACWSELAS